MAAQPDLPLNAAGNDADPQETREWQDALAGVIDKEGAERAHFLIGQMIQQAREEGVDIPYSATTEYVNSIPVDRQPPYPGNADIEIRIRNYLRWNAMAMVVRANKDTNVGGHIASYASSAALYDVGFNWFWRGQDHEGGGDLVFFQTGPNRKHVGVYIGDNRFIHASSSQGVTVSTLTDDYWQAHYITARRVTGSAA